MIGRIARRRVFVLFLFFLSYHWHISLLIYPSIPYYSYCLTVHHCHSHKVPFTVTTLSLCCFSLFSMLDLSTPNFDSFIPLFSHFVSAHFCFSASLYVYVTGLCSLRAAYSESSSTPSAQRALPTRWRADGFNSSCLVLSNGVSSFI